MKKVLTILFTLFCFVPLLGQGIEEACQFSQTYYQGTAKGLGIGNALGAVGGDMTSISINPAGMGIYRSSELAATLGLVYNYHSSKYYDETNHSEKIQFSIPNIGYVWARERSNYRPLRYTQFGFMLNRLNDYNLSTYAHGFNPNSSRTNNSTFFNQVEGLYPDNLPDDVWTLWNAFLIDDHIGSNGYYYTSNVPDKVMQGQESVFKGRSEEWMFAYSANYLDKLFIGADIGIQYLKRSGWQVFDESLPINSDMGFNRWSFTEERDSRALGVNGKIGLIWHANNRLRLGLAFHSPTIYSFDESYQTTTESVINKIPNKHIGKDNYEYFFIQPLKCVGSIAFILGQSGLISLDAEYTNFGAARFQAVADDDFDYTPNNDNIKETFGHTLNLRLGSEWRILNSYLRFGTGYYGSPCGLGHNDGSIKKASIGASFPISDNTTLDFAYELTHGKRYIFLYDYELLESIDQSQFKSLVMASVRIRL